MATPRSIEDFNQIAAMTLHKLYEAFPNPIELDPARIALEVIDGSPEMVPDSGTEHEREERIMGLIAMTAENTVDFLVEQDFIRATANDSLSSSGGFRNARLTMKGLALLESVPNPTSPTAPNVVPYYFHIPLCRALRGC